MEGLLRSGRCVLRVPLALAVLGSACVLAGPSAAAVTAPPAPANLNLQAGYDSSITLTWSASPGATSYNIYRATVPGGEGSVPYVTTASTTFTDANLSSQPVYFYQVSAVNSAGESARTPEDASKTPPPPSTGGSVPGVPAGKGWVFYGKDARLAGFDWFQSTHLDLIGWYPLMLFSPGSISPSQQVVDMAYSTEGTMTFSNVVVPASGLYTVDWRYAFASGLFPGVTNRHMGLMVNGTLITTTERFPVTGSFTTYEHSFLQVHLNAGVNSISMLAVSDHGVARVDQMTVTPASASVPSGPTNLIAKAGNGKVTLSWTASTSGNPTSYNIYRGKLSDGEAIKPIAVVTGATTTFTDAGLTNGSTYFFRVSVSNAVGVSPDSNEVSVTPTSTGSR